MLQKNVKEKKKKVIMVVCYEKFEDRGKRVVYTATTARV